MICRIFNGHTSCQGNEISKRVRRSPPAFRRAASSASSRNGIGKRFAAFIGVRTKPGLITCISMALEKLDHPSPELPDGPVTGVLAPLVGADFRRDDLLLRP